MNKINLRSNKFGVILRERVNYRNTKYMMKEDYFYKGSAVFGDFFNLNVN